MDKTAMLKQYFDQLEIGLRAKLENKVTARRKFIYEFGRLGARIFDKNWSFDQFSSLTETIIMSDFSNIFI